jgi:hypothetical protein
LRVIAASQPDTAPRVTIAFAVIQFSEDSAPLEWELALPGDLRLESVEPGSFAGFGVDGGIASFIDATLYGEIKQSEGLIIDAALRIRSDRGVGSWRYSGGDLALIQSGAGDGMYPSFFGLGPEGTVHCFATDFLVLGRPGPDDVF